jgi:hypothetical protein
MGTFIFLRKMNHHLIAATFIMAHSMKDFMGIKLESEVRQINLLRKPDLLPKEICMWG